MDALPIEVGAEGGFASLSRSLSHPNQSTGSMYVHSQNSHTEGPPYQSSASSAECIRASLPAFACRKTWICHTRARTQERCMPVAMTHTWRCSWEVLMAHTSPGHPVYFALCPIEQYISRPILTIICPTCLEACMRHDGASNRVCTGALTISQLRDGKAARNNSAAYPSTLNRAVQACRAPCGGGRPLWSAGDAQHACPCHWTAESATNASAAARLLKAREAELPGTVVLLFQPAEEGGAGGKRFVEEGALEGVLGVHGIHVWPGIPAGIITSRVISPASHTYDTLLLQAQAHA